MKSSRSYIFLRAVILSLVLLVTGNTAGLAASGPDQDDQDAEQTVPPSEESAGSASLHSFVREDNLEVVLDLLDKGADPSARDTDGRTSLHVAARYAGHRVATALLNAGAGPSARDNEGRTPLHFAARYDNSKAAAVFSLFQRRFGRTCVTTRGIPPCISPRDTPAVGSLPICLRPEPIRARASAV